MRAWTSRVVQLKIDRIYAQGNELEGLKILECWM
jgi:hypothetical protein